MGEDESGFLEEEQEPQDQIVEMQQVVEPQQRGQVWIESPYLRSLIVSAVCVLAADSSRADAHGPRPAASQAPPSTSPSTRSTPSRPASSPRPASLPRAASPASTAASAAPLSAPPPAQLSSSSPTTPSSATSPPRPRPLPTMLKGSPS